MVRVERWRWGQRRDTKNENLSPRRNAQVLSVAFLCVAVFFFWSATD
jgi:hypothetical protein